MGGSNYLNTAPDEIGLMSGGGIPINFNDYTYNGDGSITFGPYYGIRLENPVEGPQKKLFKDRIINFAEFTDDISNPNRNWISQKIKNYHDYEFLSHGELTKVD